MESKIFLFLIQFLTFFSKYKYINALCGQDVRSMEPNEVPGSVCILNNAPFNSRTENVMCSGVLYALDTVVTSEQCLNLIGQYGFVVNAGSSNIVESFNFNPIWWLSYGSWANFMQHSPNNRINDIAVVRVHPSIRNTNINPLPLTTRTPTSESFGLFLDLTGCGKNNYNVIPEVKQTIVGLVLTNQECAERTSLIRGQWVPFPPYFLCTLSYPTAFLSAGDAGGGLIFDNTLVGINIGIAPHLNGTYHPDKVNVHLSIDTYREFLVYIANV